jgi:GNAT superfamily N-acetyltransferase
VESVQVRQFNRADRDQVTALANAHIAAVVPNASVSVQALLSQLEREPGEFIVDPWIQERVTLVAEQRARVVAAAHLLRYRDDPQVSDSYRDAGEIRWLLCWPSASYWPDAEAAGEALIGACLAQLDRWQVGRRYADGTLPAPGVYGVPEQWPHVRALYERAGFRHGGRTETVHVIAVDAIPRVPMDMEARRTVGVNGTRISAVRGSDERRLTGPAQVPAHDLLGYIEVDTNLDAGSRASRLGGWADVGNLHVAEGWRRQGIGTWLLGQAADWLELGGVTRLLDYTVEGEDGYAAFLRRSGFRVLTRTVRGLVR